MISSRRLTIAAGIAAAGLLAAGCSSTPTPSGTPAPADAASTAVNASPAAFLAQATQSTTSAGSARVTFTTTVAGMAEQGVTIRGDGVVNFTDDEAALRVSSSLFGGGSDIEVTMVDGKSYIKVPMFGDKWIEAPAKEFGLSVADPGQGLQMLQKVADLQEVGPENIEGLQTTKYAGTLDLAEAIDQLGLPAGQTSEIEKHLDKIDGGSQVTVWVDSENRIIRFDQKMTINVDTGKPIETTTSTTMSDFGIDTDITPPPPDQVVSGDSLKNLAELNSGVDG